MRASASATETIKVKVNAEKTAVTEVIMKIVIKKNYDELSAAAGEAMHNVVANKPNAVISLATGTSPIGLYKAMIADCKNGVSYKKVRSFNLDEYVGQGVGDEQSYVEFMRRNLFNHIDIDLAMTDLPNGKAADLKAECDRYNAKLKKYPIDIQVLGIGSNGHIGFNEPGTKFDSVTHVIDLTENTIKDNSRFFASKDEVPKQALSMGIANIMEAKKIIMVVNGKNKAQAVYDMVKKAPSEACPASALQNHPDVTVFLDEDAAAMIK